MNTAKLFSLIGSALSQRILQNSFWQEQCYGLNEAGVVEKAINLEYVGGSFSAYLKPTPFLCLLYKLLQLSPSPDVISLIINQEDHKYLRALGMFYIRLVYPPKDIYHYIDPFFSDFRKLRVRHVQGWGLMHVDELADALLSAPRLFDVRLPFILSRSNLGLSPRKSPLLEAFTSEELDILVEKLAREKLMQETAEFIHVSESFDEISRENELRRQLGLKPLRV
ncbi:hypothetical protein RCL1_005154 [Eukaryota sp. TZLM3-RCL]